MPALALLAYLMFVMVAFGWRSWWQYRSTGDLGVRLPEGTGVDRLASLLLVAGVLLAPLACVLAWLDPAGPERPFARPVAHALGLAAFGLGFALTVLAQLQMGESWRIGVSPEERTALVTDGLFGQVRNPIFSAMLVALVGLVLLVPHWASALALGCGWLGIELQVRLIEEPYLLRTHADLYRDYARSVGRFVPGLGRLR